MMDAMDIQAVESKLNDVTVTAIPMNSSTSSNLAHHSQTQPYNFSTSGGGGGGSSSSASRYKSAHKSHLHQQQQQQQQQHHHYSQPQPAHQAFKQSGSGASSTSITSSGNHHQQQQYHHPSAYQSSLPSPSLPTSPHVSMVPVSQLSPLVADASNHHHHHQQQQHMHGHTSTPSSSRIRSSNAVASASASASSALHYPAPVTPPIQLSETSASMIAIAGGLGSLGVTTGSAAGTSGVSKYAQLLAVIEEMGRDIRPTYTGSRSSAERLKRGLVHARLLVRECLVETERSARQN